LRTDDTPVGTPSYACNPFEIKNGKTNPNSNPSRKLAPTTILQALQADTTTVGAI
jgi:hypothetical protein